MKWQFSTTMKILTILLIFSTSDVFASAHITGMVTAKSGTSLKVEFQPHKKVIPKIGDKADFFLQLDGMPVGAGTGKVTKVNEGVLWVQTSSDKPDLNMDVTIYATGEMENKTAAIKDDVSSLHRCDELAGDPNDDQRMGPAVESSSIDIDQAMSACKNAIKEYPKTARFLYQLARVYNANKQYKEAFEYFQQAADENYVIAMHVLGDVYKWGYGVKEKNYEEAVKWYKKAAVQGDVMAQYSLGQMYSGSSKIEVNYIEAAKWYRLAAIQGFPIAQYKLGEMYASGSGVKRDYTEAAKWYKKAASTGHKRSQDRLDELNEYIKTTQIKIISGNSELIDFKDPQKVAEAYWDAMIVKDYVKAENYMFPKYREIFKSAVVEGMKALAPFPEHPRVRVEIEGNDGTTIIENWEYDEGPEMLFRNGRWWIGK